MVKVQYLLADDRRTLYITGYSMPAQVRRFYNATAPFELLVTLDGGPLLYVPSWLRCSRGNPIHLNQPAPPDLAALGWKWACWHATFNEATHTTAAILNLIDEYFIGYPNAG